MAMEKQQKQVDLKLTITPALRRRLDDAARNNKLTSEEYAVNLLKQATKPIPAGRLNLKAVEEFFKRKDALFQGRKLPGDSTDIINKNRRQRTRELMGDGR